MFPTFTSALLDHVCRQGEHGAGRCFPVLSILTQVNPRLMDKALRLAAGAVKARGNTGQTKTKARNLANRTFGRPCGFPG
jgi:hypothetical protein